MFHESVCMFFIVWDDVIHVLTVSLLSFPIFLISPYASFCVFFCVTFSVSPYEFLGIFLVPLFLNFLFLFLFSHLCLKRLRMILLWMYSYVVLFCVHPVTSHMLVLSFLHLTLICARRL